MAGKIFINYRRGDDSGYAGRLYDRLQDKFDPAQLFIDVDSIAPGADFVRELNERVAACDVLLAVIGKDWIEARNAKGARRLDDPDDFVRIEIVAALSQNKRVIPVLVGGAQMPRPEELPEPLRPLARRNAVRLTYERFRADTQGLVKALQQAFEEVEVQQKSQAESEAAARGADEERRQREAEAERRATEAERGRLAEVTALKAASEEEDRLKAAAELREREERGFNAAKYANSAAAFDAFLAAHPKSHFGAEAQRLQAVLRTRETSFARAMASDDASLLRSFRDLYKNGADVEKVKGRLRLVAPERARAAPNLAALGAAAAVALAIGAGGVWWSMRPAPANHTAPVEAHVVPPLQEPPATVAPSPPTAPVAAPAAPAALRAAPPPPIVQPSVSAASEPKPVIADTAPPVPAIVLPADDEDAWSIIKNGSDIPLLRRFISQFPDSPLRRAAEARITALVAVQTAWNLLKDSNDPEELQRFIEAFPDSAERGAAEARIAELAAVRSAWNLLRDSNDPEELRRFIAAFPDSAERAAAERRLAAISGDGQPAQSPPPAPKAAH